MASTKSTSFELHFDPTGDVLEAARDCEAEVFLRAYGNTRDEIADEYGPYEDSSAFIALTDDRGDVVAETRMIAPSAAGLKTLNDTSRAPWHVDGYRAARAAGIDLTSDLGRRHGRRAHERAARHRPEGRRRDVLRASSPAPGPTTCAGSSC